MQVMMTAPSVDSSATTPRDWAQKQLGTVRYTNGYTQPLFSQDATKTQAEFMPVKHAKDLMDAVYAASEFSRGKMLAPGQHEPLVGVLQAKDGTFYLSTLNTVRNSHGWGANHAVRFGNDLFKISELTPEVDALKAIVHGRTWQTFES